VITSPNKIADLDGSGGSSAGSMLLQLVRSASRSMGPRDGDPAG
jgi:hypothetical protein